MNLKIKTKLLITITFSMIILTSFFVLTLIISYDSYLKKYLTNIKEEAYKNKKTELLNYSDMAVKIIDSYYQRTKKEQTNKNINSKDITKQMQREALLAIKNMRYGKNGYFWINNMENKMLMHPIKPQYENKFFINTPKVPFVQLGTQKLIKNKKNKEYIQYSFYTPDTKQYSHKLSIVQKVIPWNWVVGTGTYTDYLDEKIKKEEAIVKNKMKETVIYIILLSFIILIILIFIMIKLMNDIIVSPLNNFQKGLNKFFRFLDDDSVVVEKLVNSSNDEIGLMSQKTNDAIETAVKTHQELIDLRKQLEQKVNNIQEDFNAINKAKQESLEYGALLQNTLLSDESLIKNNISDYFIFNIQKNNIHSEFFIIEKLNNNEYIYILFDTKDNDINSIFSSMIINAIIKEYMNKFIHEKLEEFNTNTLLEYINDNVINSKNGLDFAVIYFNKSKNFLKYSGANISLYCNSNDEFSEIKPDYKSLGITKEIKYTEHKININEYLEFYISTNKFINSINTSSFSSPFKNQINIFKNNLSNIDTNIIMCGFKIDNKPKIIIEYEGEFTQNILNKYIEIIEDKITNIGLMSNISTNFAEQYQNILNYSKSQDIINDNITSFGYISLQKNTDNTFSIKSKNIVCTKSKDKIEPKLIEIQSLNRQDIRKRYRELRKSGANTHAKGGGIGFYEIAKRCKKVEYNFTKINEDRYTFEFISFIEITDR